MTDTATKNPTVTTTGGDHERFAHYVVVPADSPHATANGGGGVQALITEARVLGTPVRALCGKVWVPSRDPQRFPVCPDCERIKKEGNAGGMKW